MFIKGLKSALQTQERTVPLDRWFRNSLAKVGRDSVCLFGPLALFLACLLPLIMLSRPPYEPRIRSLAKTILVHSEFSYDKVCSASSDTHWVATLKDRKERDFPKVIIADLTSP